jgi:hypothetical protein
MKNMLKNLVNPWYWWNNWMVMILCLFAWQNIINAQILYVGIKETASVVDSQLEIASHFYGVEINRIILNQPYSKTRFEVNNKLLNINAVIINANCPAEIVIKNILPQIKVSIPILICGIKPQINNDLLLELSGGRINGCQNLDTQNEKGYYEFIGTRKLTSYLKGIKYTFNRNSNYSLNCNGSKDLDPIIIYRNKENEINKNIFVKLDRGNREIFFTVEIKNNELNTTSNLQFVQKDFMSFASILLFLKYSCGDKCWHINSHYANLTIDDPWLTDPYGYFSYRNVLELNNKYRFHTTIAFIPWNYDRSEREVIDFFNKNKNYFSICFHGDNHNHIEFEIPSNNSYQDQEKKIMQAIYRMRKFEELTGINYDMVMVFPQKISPSKTMFLLKKYNFLATINQGSIPIDKNPPKSIDFYLRNFSDEYENFLSIERYSLNGINQAELAINLFLDNPLFLYAHHNDFSNGYSKLINIVNEINQTDTNIIWNNPNSILRELYMQREISPDQFEILAFANQILIKNKTQNEINYSIKKKETFNVPIKNVLLNGREISYLKNANDIIINVKLAKEDSCLIIIQYKNDLNGASINISKNNIYYNGLRWISDFRDMTLPKMFVGGFIISVYYNSGLYKLGTLGTLILVIMIAIVIILILRVIMIIYKKILKGKI